MRKILTSLCLLAMATVAGAHDSVIPHKHTFDRDNSDLFVWSVAGLVVVSLIGLGVRSVRKARGR